jgi:hypothetical protein
MIRIRFPYSDLNLDPGQSDKYGSTTKVPCSLKYFNVLLKFFLTNVQNVQTIYRYLT